MHSPLWKERGSSEVPPWAILLGLGLCQVLAGVVRCGSGRVQTPATPWKLAGCPWAYLPRLSQGSRGGEESGVSHPGRKRGVSPVHVGKKCSLTSQELGSVLSVKRLALQHQKATELQPLSPSPWGGGAVLPPGKEMALSPAGLLLFRNVLLSLFRAGWDPAPPPQKPWP